MIVVRGFGSKIAEELSWMVNDVSVGIPRDKDMPLDAERYLDDLAK